MDLRPIACWDWGFEYRRLHGYLSLVSVVCCEVKISASGWSLVQRSPTECGVSECDLRTSITKRPWPSRICCATGKNTVLGEEEGITRRGRRKSRDDSSAKNKHCYVAIIHETNNMSYSWSIVFSKVILFFLCTYSMFSRLRIIEFSVFGKYLFNPTSMRIIEAAIHTSELDEGLLIRHFSCLYWPEPEPEHEPKWVTNLHAQTESWHIKTRSASKTEI
jgi:hypothetical protein